jgi:chorismate-pyruvate lyase
VCRNFAFQALPTVWLVKQFLEKAFLKNTENALEFPASGGYGPRRQHATRIPLMKPPTRFIVALLVFCVSVLSTQANAQTSPAWPDTFLARVEAVALVETLSATLLAARSATFTLDKWCEDHKLGSETKIRARLVRDSGKPITAEQRRQLQIDENEPVKFRHVELTCGSRILSEADNWYVPSRLTAEMNRLLETTDTPFGRVVADLKPFRQTFAAEVLWKPLDDGWERHPPTADHPQQALAIPPKLFEHRALLFTPDLKPISEVDETYTGENLAFAPPL